MTLVELMIVVAIVGVMSTTAIFAFARTNNRESAAALARSIHLAAQRARGEAVSDNRQRAITCDTSACSYKIANATGMAAVDFTDASKYALDGTIAYGKHATVHNMTATTDVAANNAGGAMSSAQTVVFYPDGSADKATFYVADTNASKTSNFFKIYVYQGTGLARVVSNW
jgi:Tfp pilus assembly protein FimT